MGNDMFNGFEHLLLDHPEGDAQFLGYLDIGLALSLTLSGEKARARVDEIMDAHEAGFARLLADMDEQQLRAALSLIANGRD